jgi:hypothetical protein
MGRNFFSGTGILILAAGMLLVSCTKPTVKTAPSTLQQPAFIIDFPAAIVVSDDVLSDKTAVAELSKAREILSPLSIPVLNRNSDSLVFVKTSGDRVILSGRQLSGKYDIILFDGSANPVPLRFSDLQEAAFRIFSPSRANTGNRLSHPGLVTTPDAPPADTIPLHSKKWFSGIGSRDKKLIFFPGDLPYGHLPAKNIPGLEYIEHRVDSRKILSFLFENDLITYANTDRYYTNGIAISLQSPRLAHSVFSKLMIPYGHKAFVSYNVVMVQDMYTPTDTRISPTLHCDRPYASYLYFGFNRTLSDPVRNLKISTRADLGILGPYSPGSYLQTLVHKTFPTNDAPKGWDSQIQTDLIANYNLQLMKAVVNRPKVSLLAGTTLKAGTLITSAGLGLQFQTGQFDPVFGIKEGEAWPKSEFYFFSRTSLDFIGYNALLQGGAFNKDNIFTLSGSDISRSILSSSAGFHLRFHRVGIELAQHYLSPEYKGGLWHKWGRISLMFRL